MSNHDPSNPSDYDADWALLTRYLAGECSPDERHAVDVWLAADSARRTLLAELRTLGASSRLDSSRFDPRAALQRVDARLQEHAAVERVPAERAPARTRRRYAVAIGVVAAVLLAGLAITVMRGGASREYATTAGQRQTVTLADGTQIGLAPASRVRIPVTYGRSRRDVSITGEAYFTVAHDAQRPFAVHTGNTVIEDIGTRFSVRAYPETPTVRVVVAEGTVRLRTNAGQHVLTRHMLGVVDRSGAMSVANVDPTPYLAWSTGELAFTHATLRSIIPDLDRWYGVDVQLADSAVGDVAVSATFRDESVDDAVTSLALALRIGVEHRGHSIVFRSLK